jgi:aspartate ammonia-lyase
MNKSSAGITANTPGYRVERDSLGPVDVPVGVYYGAQTARAIKNFVISNTNFQKYPNLLAALAIVKKAAATANMRGNIIAKNKAEIIIQVCDEIIDGKHINQFPIDVFQGGAGTSMNMNINEVIANRGIELLGGEVGDYSTLHPNDDVNLSQSTNDVFPTAVRLAVLRENNKLTAELSALALAMNGRSVEFSGIVKLGRTQLQDAVPMTLGQEFGAFATTIREDIARLNEVANNLREINLGGTAIGTGLNADPHYSETIISDISAISGFNFIRSENLIEASWDMGAFVLYSGMLKRVAVKLSKIANDLRLLASGPRGGLGEISLPPVQPGSSIMPGKVNPVIPEAVNQVCFEVIGNDLTITMAAEGGQLQLNAFEPVIAQNILGSIQLITNAAKMFREHCVIGIMAHPNNCARHIENSTALVTSLVTLIGYERAARLAQDALKSGKSVRELAHNIKGIPREQIDRCLDPASQT